MFFMPLPWGLRMVVCGFWGLFCFGLPGPHFVIVVGVGLGLVWFSGLLYWLEPFLVLIGFVWRV